MNLLTEPMLRVQTTADIKLMNLPELLAALGANEVESLPGLQRHQEDTLHIFLCYLGGAVLARAGINNPMQSEEFWREGLRQLAGRNDDCAWTLVVDDVMQPAFMQAPLANQADWEKFISKVEPKANTPDELDVLITAKNHDVKSQRAYAADLEAWVYALISLQTMSGQMGRGNYGIARMNSGTGSRVCVGFHYDDEIGKRWQRETQILLNYRPTLLKNPWPYRDDGQVLLWLSPWDLKSALPLTELDPFFIEISRAMRLIQNEGRIIALSAGTEGQRLAAKEQKGIVGDPWTPTLEDDKERKAWTVVAPFFSPERLRNLLFEAEGFIAPAILKLDTAHRTNASWFKASVLAPNGMCKTDGFHEATVRIPAKAARHLSSRGVERELLAELSTMGLNDTSAMQNKVLKPALYSFLEAGPEKLNYDKREVTAWVEQTRQFFSEAWKTAFFDWLWSTVEEPDKDAARLKWLQLLEKHARTTLENAIARLPVRSGRYYRSRVRAEGMFNGCRNKTFPELKEIAHAERDDGSTTVAP